MFSKQMTWREEWSPWVSKKHSIKLADSWKWAEVIPQNQGLQIYI